MGHRLSACLHLALSDYSDKITSKRVTGVQRCKGRFNKGPTDGEICPASPPRPHPCPASTSFIWTPTPIKWEWFNSIASPTPSLSPPKAPYPFFRVSFCNLSSACVEQCMHRHKALLLSQERCEGARMRFLMMMMCCLEFFSFVSPQKWLWLLPPIY